MGIRAIQLIKNRVPLKTRLRLLESLVVSHIQYSSLLLTSATEQSIGRLNRQLNWAIKVCHGRGKYDHVTQLRLTCGVLPIKDIIAQSILCKTWDILNSKSQAFKSQSLPTMVYTTNIRTGKMAPVETARSSHLQKSFAHQCINLWNDIPESLRKQTTKFKFKRLLKKHYLIEYSNLPHDRNLSGWNNYNIVVSY